VIFDFDDLEETLIVFLKRADLDKEFVIGEIQKNIFETC